MDVHSLISSFETLLQEHTGMGYFVDLLLKSLFVLVLMVIVNLFTRKLASSARHLVWSIGFICLFSLPLFIGFLPKIQVPITATETLITEGTVTMGIVTFADNMTLVMGAWWNAFVGVYFSLLGIQFFYILLGLCKVFSLSRSSTLVENILIKQELENLILEEGLTVSVGLKKSSEVYSPVSWGLFSPEIILPEQAEFWEIEKIRNVLIHELSHIQRLDWLTSLIVRISKAVYWYNPIIWYAARKLDEEAEQACDDAVILNGHCQNEYASNLLEIASHARLGNLGNTLVQAIAGSFLGSRVFSILDTSRKRQQTELEWVVRGILVGCTVIAILGSLRLVPLVNVTSISPNASTAFSVMFIPSSEASTFDGYLDNLYNYDLDNSNSPSGAQQSESAAGSVAQTLAVNEDKDERSFSSTDVMGQQLNGQQPDTEKQGSSSDSAEQLSKQPSLLDDYINARGINDNREALNLYVKEYTSDITRNVESGINFDNFSDKTPRNEGGVDQSALVAVRKIPPDYPRRARQRGIEGYSIVEYEIDRTGNVKDPKIIDSRPGSVFDRSTLQAIQEYVFEPPTVDGQVISVKGLQTKFVYQLKPG